MPTTSNFASVAARELKFTNIAFTKNMAILGFDPSEKGFYSITISGDEFSINLEILGDKIYFIKSAGPANKTFSLKIDSGKLYFDTDITPAISTIDLSITSNLSSVSVAPPGETSTDLTSYDFNKTYFPLETKIDKVDVKDFNAERLNVNNLNVINNIMLGNWCISSGEEPKTVIFDYIPQQ